MPFGDYNTLEAQTGASLDSKLSSIMILDFIATQTVGNTFLFLKTYPV